MKEAIVIGGGIGGLVHARVLADYAEQVTILERDQLPETFEPRHGVPQSQQVHYLMVRGLQILNEMFPGFETILQNRGVPRVEIGTQTHFMMLGKWMPKMETGLHTYSATRPEIEGVARELLGKHENVRFVTRMDVVDLVFDGDRVTGVVARPRGGGEQVLYPADWVVDASGRNSKIRQWLETAGFPQPETTIIDPHIGYATRWYAKPANAANDWRILYSFSSPPDQLRAGVVLEQSRDRWLVSMIGTNGDYPPTDVEEYLAFMKSLPDSTIFDSVADAEPLTDVVGYRDAPNTRHHYEKLKRLPQRLLITGDALCTVNPIYGQGMTKAMLNAQVMGKLLAEGSLESGRFYQKVAPINQEFWDTAASGDLNYPGTTSTTQESLIDRIKRGYLNAVLAGTTRDAEIAKTFNRVLNMVDPPTALLTPRMMWRVLGPR